MYKSGTKVLKNVDLYVILFVNKNQIKDKFISNHQKYSPNISKTYFVILLAFICKILKVEREYALINIQHQYSVIRVTFKRKLL